MPHEQKRAALWICPGNFSDHIVREIGANTCFDRRVRDHPEIDDRNAISVSQQRCRIQSRLPGQLAELIKADQSFQRRMTIRSGKGGRLALKISPECAPAILALNDRQHADRAVIHQLQLARPETRYGVAVIQR